jgi:hypothetical protein
MALEVTQILINAQSADGTTPKIAEDNLKQFQEQNLAAFLVSLSHELANNDKPADSGSDLEKLVGCHGGWAQAGAFGGMGVVRSECQRANQGRAFADAFFVGGGCETYGCSGHCKNCCH